ncbi:alpha/beta hydrolase [Pseudoclavibacter helvolus]|uniref:alpha/beta hydrolase n=1 Tax=Pseudoclavibacter helvolus TaxID=255205 RepID=UPI000838D36E|nr:alpha/beta hydrolase [Pseudoclavibacter helvolus]
MSGELVVVGASDVRAIAARAGLFAVDFTALRSILAAQELLPASAWLSSSGLSFAASAAQAEVAFFGGAPLELQLSSLSQRILLAAELYERAEALSRAVVDAAGASVANSLGRSIPLTVALLGPAAGIAALVALAGDAPTLSDPRIQELIRVTVENADDFALGLLGLPPVPGADGSSLVSWALAGAGLVGLIPSDSFRVASAAVPLEGRDAPPSGLQELVAAIPPSVAGGPQARITSYVGAHGEQLFEVAITGTSNQAYGSTENPFDLAGNLAAYAGIDSQSVSAALAAMEDAGIEPGDAVVFAGYSQGALVAAAIAGTGRFDTKGLVSIGGPIDAEKLREELQKQEGRSGQAAPIIEIQHREDPIVGLQGLAPDGTDSTVVFADADALSPLDDDPLAAHSQARYLETAGLADASGDPALDAARSELLGAYEGLEVEEANLYTVERLDPLPEPGEAVDEANRLIEEKFAPITTGLKPDDIKI